MFCEVVNRRPFELNRARLGHFATLRGNLNLHSTGEIISGQRILVGSYFGGRSFGDNETAPSTRPGPHVNQPVGGLHHGLVVFDNQHAVALPLRDLASD